MRATRLLRATLFLAYAPAVVIAQTCQPFWSGLAYDNPYFPLASYTTRFAFADYGSGPTIYIRPDSSPFGVSRWSAGRWEQLTNSGLTPQAVTGLGDAALSTLDDGNGPHLYAWSWGYAARWDETAWTQLPTGFSWPMYTRPIASVDLGTGPRIYGQHRLASGGSAFAWWDGTAWQDISLIPNIPTFRGTARLDDGSGPALYVFVDNNVTIGGVTITRGFGKWDGQTWSVPSLEWGPDYQGKPCFTVYDDGTGPAIYTRQGGLDSNPDCTIKKWDGHHWSCFGTINVPPFTIGGVNVLEVFDDGRGPALYIGGAFDGINGHPAHNLIRYDGHSWEEVGGGIGLAWNSGIIQDVRGRSLMIGYEGGFFNTAGGRVDGAVLWTGCATPQCYANCDRSSQSPVLNILDFMCFINRFVERDPYANCNVDAAIDVSDFLCFLNKFAAGCP